MPREEVEAGPASREEDGDVVGDEEDGGRMGWRYRRRRAKGGKRRV